MAVGMQQIMPATCCLKSFVSLYKECTPEIYPVIFLMSVMIDVLFCSIAE